MNQNPNISEEEILREKEWMDSRGKHSYDHRMIKRKMVLRKIVFIAFIVFVVISIFAMLFVLIYRNYNHEEVVSRVGDYELSIVDHDKDVSLSFDQDRGLFKILLGSGITKAHTEKSISETTLLAVTGTNNNDHPYVISSLIELAKDDMLKYSDSPETGVGKEFGVLYFDDDDKAYLATYDSYYANRFYIVNKEEESIDYKLNVTFTKGSNDCYKAARLIVCLDDGTDDLKLFAFGVANENGKNIVAQTNLTETRQGRGSYFLMDPNLKGEGFDYTLGETKFVRNPNVKSAFDVAAPEGTWMFNAMTALEGEEDAYEISLDIGSISAHSDVRMTILLYFEASDPDHGYEITNGTMGFKFEIEVK